MARARSCKRVVLNFKTVLTGKNIRLFSDNKNVTQILSIGSRKIVLQKNVLSIRKFCDENAIKLSCTWIPRESNEHADMLSRVVDGDDWEIADHVYLYLDNLWGPHNIDRFAHDYNTKCELFNSKFWCPGTRGIDAFSMPWAGYNNWLVPPPCLIPIVINKIKAEKCNCTLVIPEWTSAPFWPMINEQSGAFKYFIVDHMYFHGENITKEGRGHNGIFAELFLKFRMLALKIRF